MRFETVFSAKAAPAHWHARVAYRGADGAHELELWREGERLLRRDTDRKLTLVARHVPGDTAYKMDLFDHRRRIHSLIDRDSLYRIGRFTDWADLAHGLQHPGPAYKLKPTVVRVVAKPAPVAPCRWYDLTVAGRTSRICWSAAEAYPIEILDGRGKVVLRVLKMDHAKPAPAVFRPRYPGYVVDDAAADIIE